MKRKRDRPLTPKDLHRPVVYVPTPPPLGWGVKRWCPSSVCPSVCSVPESREYWRA